MNADNSETTHEQKAPTARVRLTVKQRARVDEIEEALESARDAVARAKDGLDAWARDEDRKLNGEMSSRISAASHEHDAAIVGARGMRANRMKEIEREYRQLCSAAEATRAKARNAADAAEQAERDRAQSQFNEASAPVEQWYKAEKIRIAAEAQGKLAEVAVVFEAQVKALVEEREAIQAKAKAKAKVESESLEEAADSDEPDKSESTVSG
jgi:hypothetical protein